MAFSFPLPLIINLVASSTEVGLQNPSTPVSRWGGNTDYRYHLGDTGYSGAMASILSGTTFGYYRESCEIFAKNGGLKQNYAPYFASGGSKYQVTLMPNLAFTQGRICLMEFSGWVPNAPGNTYTDGVAGTNTWGDYIAWRAKEMINNFPYLKNGEFCHIATFTNEWDLTVPAGSWLLMLRDKADPDNIAYQNTVYDRIILGSKIVFNEFEGNADAKYRKNLGRANYAIVGPSTGYPVQTAPSGTYPQKSRGAMAPLMRRNNYELFNYVHAWDHHWHQDQWRIEGVNGEAVANDVTSPYHIGVVMREAASVVGSALARKPLIASEDGLYYDGNRGETAAWPDLEWLRQLRIGTMCLGHFWFGHSIHYVFTVSNSGAYQSFFDGYTAAGVPTYRVRTVAPYVRSWDVLKKNYEFGNFNWPTGQTSKQFPMIAKQWIDFNDITTWGPFVNCNETALGTMPTSTNPLNGNCPFGEFRDVSMQAGKIVVSPTYYNSQTGTRRTLGIPTKLRKYGNFLMQARVKFTGTNGGVVRIRPRGSDNGDPIYDPAFLPANVNNATATGNTTAYQTIYCPFSTGRHNSPYFPDDAQVLVAVDGDGGGNNQWTVDQVSITEL